MPSLPGMDMGESAAHAKPGWTCETKAAAEAVLRNARREIKENTPQKANYTISIDIMAIS